MFKLIRYSSNTLHLKLFESEFLVSMEKIRQISRELQIKAFKDLNEVPANTASNIAALKKWIHQTPHLKARTDDQFLLTFLRGSKHNLEKAKAKIEMFYTCRTAMPEIMTNRDPLDPKLREIIKLGVGLPLPLTESKDSSRVVLIRPGVYDATQYRIIDIMKVANMICDILLIEDDNLVISGEVAIVDFMNVTKSHLLQLDPLLVKKLTLLNQEGSPLKQNVIHYVHTPPGFDVVFNLFKSIMVTKEAQQDQAEIFIHQHTHETLRDHIDTKILPTEYGGQSGPLQAIIQFWEKKLIEYRDYFIEEDNYGTIESLRPPQYRHFNADFLNQSSYYNEASWS